MLPGQFWDGCDYNKVLLEEKKRMKPKKSTPMQILIQQQFLVDQGKTKKAEQAWFDKLEDELERMEMDELLVQYKLENAQKKINKEVGSNIEANSEQDLKDRPALSDVLNEEIAIKDSNDQQQVAVPERSSEGVSKASSSVMAIDYNMDTVKGCIQRISLLNNKQQDRAMKETARNRKVNSIGSFENMTIGQAYYNLNKTNVYGSNMSTQRASNFNSVTSPQGSQFKRNNLFGKTSAF